MKTSHVRRIVIIDIDSDRKPPASPVSIKYLVEQFGRQVGNPNQELDLAADMQALCMGLVTLISAADKRNIKSKKDSLNACIKALRDGVEKELLDGDVTA